MIPERFPGFRIGKLVVFVAREPGGVLEADLVVEAPSGQGAPAARQSAI